MESEPEYTLPYWIENFVNDVEEFGKFWVVEARRHGGEFPDRMTLSDWDRQFIQWMSRTTTDRQN